MATPVQAEVLHSNDSKSLWNYTLSPGWTEREVEVLRIALMKFGLGKWTRIVESRCLPGKTVAQLSNQTQRLIGQQSTSTFTGLHVDPSKVFADNALKQGLRKNGCLINTDDNPTSDAVKRQRTENQAKYGLSMAEVDALEIPILKQEETSTVVIKSTLNLKDTANWRREQYDRLRALDSQLARLKLALERAADQEEQAESGREAADEEPAATAAQTRQSAGTKRTKAAKQPAKKPAKRVKQTKLVAPAKAQGKTKKPAASGKKRAKPHKSQEERDLALALKLQREEGGMECDDVPSEDSDEDFVLSSRGRRVKTSRATKKRRAQAN